MPSEVSTNEVEIEVMIDKLTAAGIAAACEKMNG
jgi:hypothetical protein